MTPVDLNAVLQLAQEQDVFQAIQMLEQLLLAQSTQSRKRWQPVGHNHMPAQETLRFKAAPGVAFNGANITRLIPPEKAGEPTALHVSFMALTGFNGALPRHYSELVMDRLRHKDRALADFLDLFNHRLVSLFYRAWQKYRLPARYDYNTENPIHRVIAALSGQPEGEFEPAFAYYAGLFLKAPRNAGNLAQLLGDLFRARVEIRQFAGRWLQMAPDEQTRICRDHRFNRLGEDAVLGRKAWSCQDHIDIHIRCRHGGDTDSLRPGGRQLPLLRRIVRTYLGEPLTFNINLVLPANSQRPMALGTDNARLARHAWMLSGNARPRPRSLRFRGDTQRKRPAERASSVPEPA